MAGWNDPSLLSVATLVLLILKGCRDWPWAEIVRRYEKQALALAQSLVHDIHEARDVVQFAFAKANLQLTRYDLGRDFWPWFAGIVIYTGLDWLRKIKAARRKGLKGVGGEYTVDCADRAPGPLAILIDREERQVLWPRIVTALLSLKPVELLVFGRFYVLGESVAIIARSYKKSEGAIHCVRSRAKAKFMKHFPGAKLTNNELKELFDIPK